MSSTIRPDPQSGVSLVELLTGMTVAVLLVGSTLTGVVSHQNQRRVHSERILAMAACRNTMATLRSVDVSTLPTPWTSQAFADAVVAADREDDAATALDQVPARALDDQTRTRLWAVATGLGPDELRMSALAMLERSGDKTPLPADFGTWSPELRYRAARVGLVGGDPRAPGLMVELAFDSDPEDA